eukprot:jgi/Bigna1/87834/estExt_fgenesh1_pg.C_240206
MGICPERHTHKAQNKSNAYGRNVTITADPKISEFIRSVADQRRELCSLTGPPPRSQPTHTFVEFRLRMNFSLDLKDAEAARCLRYLLLLCQFIMTAKTPLRNKYRSPSEQEELKMLGPEVQVCFVLPSEKSFTKTFRMGNLVEHLKVAVQSESNIPFEDQELYMGETLMADPLMIRDLWKNEKEELRVSVKQLKSSSKKLEDTLSDKQESKMKSGDVIETEEVDEEYAESTDEEYIEKETEKKETSS